MGFRCLVGQPSGFPTFFMPKNKFFCDNKTIVLIAGKIILNYRRRESQLCSIKQTNNF